MRATPKISTLVKRFGDTRKEGVFNFFSSYVSGRDYQWIYEAMNKNDQFTRISFFTEYATNMLNDVFVSDKVFHSATPYIYVKRMNLDDYKKFNRETDILKIGDPNIENKEHSHVYWDSPFTFIICDNEVHFCLAISLYNELMDGYANNNAFSTIFIKMDDFINVFETYMYDIVRMLFIDSGIRFKYKEGMLLSNVGLYLNFMSYTPSEGQLKKYRNNLNKVLYGN